jgi:hypothetical protein
MGIVGSLGRVHPTGDGRHAVGAWVSCHLGRTGAFELVMYLLRSGTTKIPTTKTESHDISGKACYNYCINTGYCLMPLYQCVVVARLPASGYVVITTL